MQCSTGKCHNIFSYNTSEKVSWLGEFLQSNNKATVCSKNHVHSSRNVAMLQTVQKRNHVSALLVQFSSLSSAIAYLETFHLKSIAIWCCKFLEMFLYLFYLCIYLWLYSSYFLLHISDIGEIWWITCIASVVFYVIVMYFHLYIFSENPLTILLLVLKIPKWKLIIRCFLGKNEKNSCKMPITVSKWLPIETSLMQFPMVTFKKKI